VLSEFRKSIAFVGRSPVFDHLPFVKSRYEHEMNTKHWRDDSDRIKGNYFDKSTTNSIWLGPIFVPLYQNKIEEKYFLSNAL
jgi:hypothetical protein